MSFRLSVITVIVLLTAAACTATTPSTGSSMSSGAEASMVAPIIGIVINDKFQIVEFLQGGPAEKAGFKIGDTLLDVAWDSKSTPEPTETPNSPTAEPAPIAIVSTNVSGTQSGDLPNFPPATYPTQP